ncbi:MAG: hypothetical protein ACUBOA_09255 [Candidatus Loosdrechtia sp.]|uniref:hypothetical protein n=1 Tax=Candidatus Loosdrechtia sp. TaxID=3101272 RepID=UPI003A789A82|nr:MAG: hypothetical protein QY305_02790 [Candidatus Jettenia sp. AMX2]
MFKKTYLFAFILGLILNSYLLRPAHGVYSKLTPAQIREAIEYGQKNKNLDIIFFSNDWSVSLGKGKGFATLFTPYHSLAYKARKFAVERREFTNREIQETLQNGDPLAFTATVYGDEYDFALYYSAVLYQDETAIQPEFEFVPEIADASEFWPDSPAYLARLVFKFPTEDVNLNAPVTFTVQVPGGEEILFDFDLSNMK